MIQNISIITLGSLLGCFIIGNNLNIVLWNAIYLYLSSHRILIKNNKIITKTSSMICRQKNIKI